MPPTRSRKTQSGKPRRGRPLMSEDDRRRMKAEIAATAQRLFQADGYAEVSMRKIATEIGCTPMTLYSYYDAKIDILRTLWAGVFEDVFSQLAALPPTDHPKDQLANLCVAYVTYWSQHPDHYRLVFMAEGVTQPEVSLFLDRQDIAQQFLVFADALEAAVPPPVDQAKLKVKLDLLICVLHGIAHNHITISGYPWSSARDMLDVALEGVLAA